MSTMAGAGRRGGVTTTRAFRPRVRSTVDEIWRNMTRERRRGSPRGCGGLRCDGGRKTTTTGGEGDRALAEEGDAEVAGPSGLRGSIREAPAEATRGLRGPAVHRRQAIAAAAVLTCGGLREKFGPNNRPESRVEGTEAPG
jgi:hypothetical protein